MRPAARALVMRRRLVGGAGGVVLRLLQPFVQARDLPRQCVDLLPLRGYGVVQRLDGFVLERQPDFKRVDAVAEHFRLTHLNHVPFGVPASRGRARRGRQRQSIRRASGSPLPARLRGISGCRP